MNRKSIIVLVAGAMAVLSLDNKLLYRGCSPLPSPDGYLLICGQIGGDMLDLGNGVKTCNPVNPVNPV